MPQKKKIILVLTLIITLPLAALLTLFLKDTQNAFAIVQETESVTTDTEFSTGTLTSTIISGSGPTAKVQLEGGVGPASTEYKLPVTIDNTGGGALTDYQVKITLDTQTLISGGKMQSDCDDIRVNNSDESTPIPDYWLGGCNTTTSSLWVKVPSISAASNKTIYIYYGNDSAVDAASPNTTFEIFDITGNVMWGTFRASFGMTTAGQMYSWGGNSYGLHGIGSNSPSSSTTPVLSLGSDVRGGDPGQRGSNVNSSCYIQSDGTVQCWGYNQYGNIGNGETYGNNYTPADATEFSAAKDISVEGNFTCAVLLDGTVDCVGLTGATGGFADTLATTNTVTAVTVDGISNAVAIDSERYSIFILLDTGEIKAWGMGTNYKLGTGTTANKSTPTSVVGMTNAVDFSVAETHGCAIIDDGTVECWGYGGYGQMGNGTYNSQSSPVPVGGISDAIQVSTGYNYTCVLHATGSISCFGDGADGRLGNGAVAPQNSLVSVSGITNAVEITTNYKTTCALLETGAAKCWGYGGYGNIGDGNATSYNVPTDVIVYNFGAQLMRENGNDTTPSLGDKKFAIQYVATPPTTSNGSETAPLETSGTWESATMDIEWNGGWGDGTGGSTTLSSTVTNVGANATITYSIRAADSEANLSSASYEVIGIANSGTSFTATKTDLDGLAVPTGSAGRYIQLKADLASVDELTNPSMSNIDLSYMEDNTAPEVQTTSLAMFQSNGGLSVPDTTWTPNNEPHYTWTDATDSQAGIAGYCLYLGTDIAGDPEISKGLLGTSPLTITDEPCPFIATTNTIDFSDTDLHGGTWLSSDTSLYYLNVKAIDVNNNVIGTSVQHSFKYDDTIPTPTEFLSLPGDYISDKGATIYWPTGGVSGALDTHSGVAGLQYKIGSGGTWYGDNHTGTEDLNDLLANDGSYTFVSSPDFANMAEGPNHIYLRAVDTAGNPSTTYAMGILKINTNAPSSPLNLVASPTTNTSNLFGFTWGPPSTYTGQPDKISYCYTVNTLPSAQTCQYTAQGVTSLSADAYATQPGVNTIYVVAKDEAGNTNYGTYISTQFTANTSAPGLPESIEIADVSSKANSDWKLALSWGEPLETGAGVSYYDITHSDNNLSYTQEATSTDVSYFDLNLVQKYHYYKVRACDSANNCGAYTSPISMFPDGKFTEPAILLSGPTNSGVTTKKATLSWTTDRASDSKVQLGLRSGEYFDEETSNSDQTTDHLLSLNNLTPGTEYFYVIKWTDEDGNIGTGEEGIFKTAPPPSVAAVRTSNVGINSAIISFTITGAYKANVLYGPSASYGGIETINTSPIETEYSVQLTGLVDGTEHHYSLDLEDEEGNIYGFEDHSFTTPPVPKISNIQIEDVKDSAQPTLRVYWDTNTATSSIITYSPTALPDLTQDIVEIKPVDGEHILDVTGLSAETLYSLTISGLDNFGNKAVSDLQQFTTATDTRSPRISKLKVIGSILPANVQPNKAQSAQLIVSWETDEPATSQVEYAEGTSGDYSQKTTANNDLSYHHVVVISNLTPSKVYHLRGISNDHAQNIGKSVDYISITPKATDSVLELVFGSLADIFDFLR